MSANEIPALREKVFGAVFLKSDILAACKTGHGDDDRLIDLHIGLGQLVRVMLKPDACKEQLERIAAYCIGWVMALGEDKPFDLVHGERMRQQRLFRSGQYNFTCASTTAGYKQKFRILAEEAGEVAKEVDHLEYAVTVTLKKKVTAALIVELVQVAAVCVAWLEALGSAATTGNGGQA